MGKRLVQRGLGRAVRSSPREGGLRQAYPGTFLLRGCFAAIVFCWFVGRRESLGIYALPLAWWMVFAFPTGLNRIIGVHFLQLC